jgi:2-(1,2-epoxy-1,2-dihydrophenyl)acetyl-CoA isomerase
MVGAEFWQRIRQSRRLAMEDAVLLAIQDGVARITLNRPQAGNTMDTSLSHALFHAALQVEADPSVRVVLLSGAGSGFSAGGDLRSFQEMGDTLPAHTRELTTYLHGAVQRLAGLPAVVIAVVHGAAAGGGFSLAMGCDLVLAAESAKFVMAYTKIGLAPDLGGTYYLPRLVGLRRALELALLNPVLSAQQAKEYGLVTEVVPDAELSARAKAVAASLAAGPAQSFAITKKLLRQSCDTSLESQLEAESRAISACTGTPDGREGVAAFLEKRKPKFAH